VEHLPALYHGATALVFPSLIEGFGLPVLEAMASATPVITSNCSSLPEVAGEAALYVNPVDSGDIARGLARIASDLELREQLKARGLERSARFHPHQLGRELLSVYRLVAHGYGVDGAGVEERVTSPH
jgi:glycosyltransferase involved in cell wall biosynthesis